MKSYFVVSVLCTAVIAVFAQGPNNPANFDTAKTKMSANADQRMEILKEFKSCVEAATDTKALKECKNKEMTALKAMKPNSNKRPRNMDMNGSGTGRGQGQKSMM